MSRQAAWARDGHDWPNRAASQFVKAGGINWHVQVMGAGPIAVLAHGTGAATHSWRDLAPLLAQKFTVVAPDLPGHGFSDAPAAARLSLPGMAGGLKALLDALGLPPVLAVGHSAGAAILARMCLDGMIAPRGLVSLNGAFLPLDGMQGQIFAPLARLLAGLPLLPHLFAWQAGGPGVVQRLLQGTGSSIDRAGETYYARVIRNPDHAAAALRMMANWDLAPLMRDLPKLRARLLLVAGDRDRAVPPRDAARVRALVPGAELVLMPGFGHLAHEEDFSGTAALIDEFARRAGALDQ